MPLTQACVTLKLTAYISPFTNGETELQRQRADGGRGECDAHRAAPWVQIGFQDLKASKPQIASNNHTCAPSGVRACLVAQFYLTL